MGSSRRTGRRVAAAVVASLALGGCLWPAPGAGPGRAASNSFESELTTATVADLGLLWTATGDGGRMSGAVTSIRAVHAYDFDGLYAFDFNTGARLWSQANAIPGISTIGPVVADGERVVFGSGMGNGGGNWTTATVDADTGAALGSTRLGLVDGIAGTVMLTRSWGFGSGTPVASRIRVTDSASPATSWVGLIAISDLGAQILIPGTLGTTRVYLAGAGAVSPEGSGNAVRAYPVVGPPPGCPAPIPPDFTCPLWTTLLDGTTARSPVITGGLTETVVYTGTDAGTVYALDAGTGAILWTASVPGAVAASPALAGGSLYVPSTAGGLVVLDAATGAAQWTAPTATALTVQPAVAGGVVYVGETDGTLSAFDAAGCGYSSCAPLWTYSTGTASITGAPAVNQGRLYVGTADSRLLAFGLPAS